MTMYMIAHQAVVVAEKWTVQVKVAVLPPESAIRCKAALQGLQQITCAAPAAV